MSKVDPSSRAKPSRIAAQAQPDSGTEAAESSRAEVQDPTFCTRSSDCPEGQTCCETPMGESVGIVCVEPNESRFPCHYREACAPDQACLTKGARCMAGFCEVEPKQATLQCGSQRCAPPTNVCWWHETGEVECTSDTSYQQEGFKFRCLGQSDCALGEFCNGTPLSTYCEHAWDGISDILCRADEECHAQFSQHCADTGLRAVCGEPDENGLLPGLRSCRCE